jgi:peptidoglycan/xylan/chitin deacetylase (PgdA/CDA1 family)
MAPMTVLMYHALSDAGAAGDADPHYALPAGRLRRHLSAMRAAGRAPCSVAQVLAGELGARDAVALTFDDGHASNAAAAAEVAAAGGRADFFVNPATVGRPGYLPWSELRGMADAGMSVQSHGATHRFLDALTPREVAAELADSRKEIEDRLGRAVLLFAPAGGRMPARFAARALEAGYHAVCTSRPGRWTPDRGVLIPRLAVLASTADARLERWIAGAQPEMLLQLARYAALRGARRLVGGAAYRRLRSALLAARSA